MRKVGFVMLVASVSLLIVGCWEDSTDVKVAEKQETSLAEANRQVGLPAIVNFQEMKLMRSLYEVRDQANLLTITYIVDLNGHLHFLTKSVGYPLPYGTQFSNPEHIVRKFGGRYVMPNAEPNGLFMPPTAEATWVIARSDTGELLPIYVEERVITTLEKFPLKSVD
jgi:hypothetical protein